LSTEAPESPEPGGDRLTTVEPKFGGVSYSRQFPEASAHSLTRAEAHPFPLLGPQVGGTGTVVPALPKPGVPASVRTPAPARSLPPSKARATRLRHSSFGPTDLLALLRSVPAWRLIGERMLAKADRLGDSPRAPPVSAARRADSPF
jgi:hypothetical protein